MKLSLRLWMLVLGMVMTGMVLHAGQSKNWKQLPPIPYTGAINNIAMDDNGVLYASNGSQVFYSMDNGLSWSSLFAEGEVMGTITDIATQPGHPKTVVIGSDWGVFWTTNGSNWRFQDFEVDPHAGLGGGVVSLLADPNGPVVYADRYVMQLGGGWQRTIAGKLMGGYAILKDGSVLALDPADTSGGHPHIYRSTDHGTTWTLVQTDLPAGIPVFVVDGDGTVYAFVTQTINGKRKISYFSSMDNGANWQSFAMGRQGLPANAEISVMNIDKKSNTFYARAYTITATQGSAWLPGMYISTDTMKTWQLLEGTTDLIVYEMVVAADGNVFFVTDNKGVVFYDMQKRTAEPRNSGMNSYGMKSLVVAANRLFVFDYNSMLTTNNDGKTWTSITRDGKRVVARATAVTPSGELLVGMMGTKGGDSPLYKSTDGGVTWTAIGNALISDHAYWTGVEELQTDATGTLYAETRNSGDTAIPSALYSSMDGGQNWQKIADKDIDTAMDIASFRIAPSGAIFLVGLRFHFFKIILVSTNHGATWKEATLPFDPTFLMDNPFSTEGNRLYAATMTGTYFTEDNGATWQKLLTESQSFRLFFDRDGNVYLSSAQDGVLFSRDGGVNWENISQGLSLSENSTVTDIQFSGDNVPYAMLSNGKLFRAFDIVSDVPESAAFSQSSVYPNPFSDFMFIQYILPQSGPVHIRLFDLSGHEIYSVALPNQNAGENTLSISGAAFAPGLYTYRISAGNTVLSGTLLRK